MSDISIENLVPASLRDCPSSEFLASLSSHDAHFAALNQAALNDNCVLRYVGSVSSSGYTTSLKRFASDHPFAALKGSGNVICFVTKRFPNGIIVQGAGAGAAVTAFGMYADVLKIWASAKGGPIA
jgi:homoserine dehydrogenase